jgi:hypothetical protein
MPSAACCSQDRDEQTGAEEILEACDLPADEADRAAAQRQGKALLDTLAGLLALGAEPAPDELAPPVPASASAGTEPQIEAHASEPDQSWQGACADLAHALERCSLYLINRWKVVCSYDCPELIDCIPAANRFRRHVLRGLRGFRGWDAAAARAAVRALMTLDEHGDSGTSLKFAPARVSAELGTVLQVRPRFHAHLCITSSYSCFQKY